MKKIKHITFAIITVCISLVFIDLAIHLAAFTFPRVDQATSFLTAKIPDSKLGHRPNPAFPGHDEKGFRNPTLPATVDIVALGDSQTYGSGVKSEQAWPRVLESLNGRSVYNMGLGGYGPVHSLLLWDEAREFKPSIIIEALYAGNDLYDAFSMVYTKEKAPQFKSDNPALLEIIKEEEAIAPLNNIVSELYRRGEKKSSLRKTIKTWLAGHSRIYGLIKRTQYEFKKKRKSNKPLRNADDIWKKAQSFAEKNEEYALAFSEQNTRTVLTPKYRLAALNMEDPRIREGQRISLDAIRQMRQLANRDGIRFIVLLIPTKELVFSELAKNLYDSNYLSLIENEKRFWQETKLVLAHFSIEYVDSLPALQKKLTTDPQPYMLTHNGHPNQYGQRIIAATVRDYLAKKRKAR